VQSLCALGADVVPAAGWRLNSLTQGTITAQTHSQTRLWYTIKRHSLSSSHPASLVDHTNMISRMFLPYLAAGLLGIAISYYTFNDKLKVSW
jgi:hypothetical protein